jgi:hypothetical protein
MWDRERSEGGDIERREIGELTCGPTDISRYFSLLSNRKLLF